MLELTTACDIGRILSTHQRCVACYYPEEGRVGTLEWSQDAKDSLEQLLRERDIGFAYLEGGEALLHSQFWEIADFFKDSGVKTVLLTHGLTMSPELARQIIAHNIKGVQMSINYLPQFPSRLTQEIRMGSDGRVLDAIRILDEARQGYDLRIGICTVITRENLPYIAKMGETLQQIGVNYFKPQPYHTSQPGRLKLRPSDVQSLSEQLRQLAALQTDKFHIPSDIYLKTLANPGLYGSAQTANCPVPAGLICVSNDWIVRPCQGDLAWNDPGMSATISDFSRIPSGNYQCRYLNTNCVSMWDMANTRWLE